MEISLTIKLIIALSYFCISIKMLYGIFGIHRQNIKIWSYVEPYEEMINIAILKFIPEHNGIKQYLKTFTIIIYIILILGIILGPITAILFISNSVLKDIEGILEKKKKYSRMNMDNFKKESLLLQEPQEKKPFNIDLEGLND